MEYKEQTKEVYDKYAKEFEKRTESYMNEYILKDAELFIANLSGNRILDLGSGPGRDSLFFLKRGLKPLCLDISPEMIQICRNKGLDAQIGDLENLTFERELFDGVWAYTSLLHIPKNNFSRVLKEVKEILKPKGILYLGMKEGNFEGFIESDKYNGAKRFFSLYSDKELREHLQGRFEIMHFSKVIIEKAVFLNYLCQK